MIVRLCPHTAAITVGKLTGDILYKALHGAVFYILSVRHFGGRVRRSPEGNVAQTNQEANQFVWPAFQY